MRELNTGNWNASDELCSSGEHGAFVSAPTEAHFIMPVCADSGRTERKIRELL